MKKIWVLLLIGVLVLPNAFAALSRSFSSTSVNSGSQVTVTISGGSGFTGIIETLPAGWSIVDTGNDIQQSGQEVRAYFMGASYTYTAIAGTTLGNVTFNGVFESTSGNGNIIGSNTILVGECLNGQCNSNVEVKSTNLGMYIIIAGIVAFLLTYGKKMLK